MKRRTILSSILAIIACIAVISGSTFALFTSESSVNIAVTSGRVKMTASLSDLALYSADATLDSGTPVDKIDSSDTTGKILPTDDQGEFAGTYYYKVQDSTFANGGTAILDGGTLTIDRMTPGDKVAAKLNIKNESNVAIKYRLKIVASAVDETDADTSKILEILKVRFEGKLYTGLSSYTSSWTTKAGLANDTNETYDSTLEIIFPLDAGNEYRANRINLDITVEAVQSNANTVDAGTVEYVSPTTPVTQIATVSSVVTEPTPGTTTATLVAPTAPLAEDGAKTEVVLTNVADANKEVKLTVETVEYDRTESVTSYSVLSDTQTAVASVDLTLEVDNKVVSAFETDASAKITTYVVKGLNDISVVYNGDSSKAFGQGQPISRKESENLVASIGDYYYDTTTGKLVFMTNHFSEYVPATKDVIRVINITNNSVHETLKDAVEKAITKDELQVVKDLSVDEIIVIPEEMSLTLDLNGKTISNNVVGTQSYEYTDEDNNVTTAAGRAFVLTDESSLTINANGGKMIIPETNLYSSGFFRVYTAVLTINGGEFTGNTDDGTLFHAHKFYGAEISLNDVSATTNYRFVASNGKVYGKLNVIGGTFTQNNGGLSSTDGTIPAFYVNTMEATFKDAIISSYWGSCVEICGSYINKEDGYNIVANFTGDNVFTVTSNNTIQNWNCTAITVDNDGIAYIDSGIYDGYKYGAYIFTSNGHLYISGGRFIGETAVQVDHNDYPQYYPSTPSVEITGGRFKGNLVKGVDTELVISGGSYTVDPTEYLDTVVYKIFEYQDGTYGVGTDNTYVYEDDRTTVNVTSGAGLRFVDDMFLTSPRKDLYIKLANDINFIDFDWIPRDSHSDNGYYKFAGLDGQGFTIKNFTVIGQAMFTRFASTGTVVIKNIVFDNALVKSSSLNTSLFTVQSYQNLLLDKVTMKNSYVEGTYKVAPLIATIYNENPSTITCTIKDCVVDNVTVVTKSYDYFTTGMVSFVYVGDNDVIVFEGNNVVSNVLLKSKCNTGYAYHAAIYCIDTDDHEIQNTAENVTVTNVVFEDYFGKQTTIAE